MCKSCGQLHIYERFRSMSQYAHEISKIRGLADWGDIEVEYAAIPLYEIDGGFRGYCRHEIRCVHCGARFAVWVDSSAGAEGAALSGGLCLID